jgi:PPK2 family polyphosphate:nucleotide phosphotransferase
VVGQLNPRGVAVTSFGVPTLEERQHDFLWRVHRHAPRLGEFAIFNRSHYEDVLVVRVHDLAPKKLWRERYGHIADFEELLAEHGTIVLKYFLHIGKSEQKERLLEREADPKTAWKLNPNDWKERDYWDDYTRAYEDAISKTAAPHAPWPVVPANAKWYRNLVIAESIVEALRGRRKPWERKLAEMGKAGRAGLDAYRAELAARKRP